MSDIQPPLEELKRRSSRRGRDPVTRKVLYILVALWVLTLIALIVVAWRAYFDQKEKTQTLAQQITLACELGTIGPPDFTTEQAREICDRAAEEKPAEIIQGPPGPPGSDGQDGADGTDGTDGQDGRNGRNGEDGDPGSNGEDGTPGAPGETGSAGPAGPPGPQGEQGAPGNDGTDGTDAVPFTFSFTVGEGPLSRTYTCVINEPNTSVVCE